MDSDQEEREKAMKELDELIMKKGKVMNFTVYSRLDARGLPLQPEQGKLFNLSVLAKTF
jgi:hypothetical protein